MLGILKLYNLLDQINIMVETQDSVSPRQQTIGKSKKWYVYILQCLDGTYYTGVTNDIDKRMEMHATGKGSKYVASRGFSHLIATKECMDKSDACKAEYLVKKLPRCEKLEWFAED
jgi:putative endonuclease